MNVDSVPCHFEPDITNVWLGFHGNSSAKVLKKTSEPNLYDFVNGSMDYVDAIMSYAVFLLTSGGKSAD